MYVCVCIYVCMHVYIYKKVQKFIQIGNKLLHVIKSIKLLTPSHIYKLIYIKTQILQHLNCPLNCAQWALNETWMRLTAEGLPPAVYLFTDSPLLSIHYPAKWPNQPPYTIIPEYVLAMTTINHAMSAPAECGRIPEHCATCTSIKTNTNVPKPNGFSHVWRT